MPSYRLWCVTTRSGRQRPGLHREPVVLRGDLHAAGLEVLHRVVAAAVPELQLEGPGAQREARGSDGPGRCRRPGRPPRATAARSPRPRAARAGSPGPLLRNTPSGRGAQQISLAGVAAGKHTHAGTRAPKTGAGCSTSSRSRRPRRAGALPGARRAPGVRSRDPSGGDRPRAAPAPPSRRRRRNRTPPGRSPRRTRSAPSIEGARRARSTSSPGDQSPVPMTPRITPDDRRRRVSARVSRPAMATMPCSSR